ncbi:MAG: hypothetical protein ACSHX9_00070 [Luteolibacter sp.]
MRTRIIKISTTTIIRFLLILAVATIVYGHIAIMASGKLFDKVNKEPYNLHTRWVSDFAAKWPEGSWIKIGILLTCIAVGLLYYVKYKNLPATARNSIESWFYHIVPLAIIVGLVLVVSYDISHPREQWVTRGTWPFQSKELVHAPKNSNEWTVDWYHRLGFRVFVASFLVAVGGGLMIRWKKRGHPTTPLDWLILFSTLACAAWLFTTITSLPGIPQRFLLATVFVWLWREAGILNSQESLPHQSDPPAAEVT